MLTTREVTVYYESVLLDALCTAYGYTRAEAEEALRYAANLGAVQFLLDSQLPVYCGHCGAHTGHAIHDQHCAQVRAWEALEHRYGHAAVGLAFDRARPVRPYRVDDYMRRAAADVENGIATRDLGEGELATVRLDARGARIFTGLEVPTVAAGAGRVTLPRLPPTTPRIGTRPGVRPTQEAVDSTLVARTSEAFMTALMQAIETALERVMRERGISVAEARARLSRTQEYSGHGLTRIGLFDGDEEVWVIVAQMSGDAVRIDSNPAPVRRSRAQPK